MDTIITRITLKDARTQLKISFDYEEQYEFQKLYDLLTDMNIELTDCQHSIFEKIRDAKDVPTYPEPDGDPSY